MLKNISNNISTDIFQSFTGALPLAPVKLSGYYKIFIDKNLDLYLDDYNNRRFKIDKSQSFLPQVSNFLKTKNLIFDENRLKYGGFRNNQELTYHIPLYINNEKTLPKYFVINKIPNETITNNDDLTEFGKILNIIDLDKIGLTKIFNEIIEKFDYILNFNWEENNIKINGFGINEEVIIDKTIDISDLISNQNYLNVVNNKILNYFKNNDIIFPKFINVEFEFNYDEKTLPFNNFYGYLAYKNEINYSQLNVKKNNIKLLEYQNKIDFFQKDLNLPINYTDIIYTSKITKPENKLPEAKIVISNISIGDYIKIIHPDNSIFFEYIVESKNIKNTLRETLRNIVLDATKLSGNNLIFTSDALSNTIKIVFNGEDLLIDDYQILTPSHFLMLNNSNRFNYISNTDIIVNSINIDNSYQSVKINNNFYNVKKYFYFDGKLILRLDNFDNQIINNINFVEIYENKVSKLIELNNIPFLGFNNNLISNYQYDKLKYIDNLIDKFGLNNNPEFLIAINKFKSINNFIDKLPYINIDEFNNEIESKNIIINNNENDINVLNMMFCSPGNTSYITPNILNFDKQFYDKSCNQEYKLLENDEIRFHYFLIKSETPEYLLNTNESLRYFIDKPKLTSKLICSAKNIDYCETIFLGSKYRLPHKYNGWNFAVYLDFNDEKDFDINYSFDINENDKTIFLRIGMYLDFVDLIRGGNKDNSPLLDLSFFYSVTNPFNTNSESLFTFKTGGLLLCDDILPVMYEQNIINDWKFFDSTKNKWYICIKRSLSILTPPLTELFTNDYEQYFYVYSNIEYNGNVYNYVSLKFKITGIIIINDDYIWCEDISIKFFDTNDFFVNKYGPSILTQNKNQIFKVKKENVIQNLPSNTDQAIISTIVTNSSNQQFKLINYDREFSLKKDYFEFGKKNIFDTETNQTILEYKFVFPESPLINYTFQDFVNLYGYDSFDDVTYDSKISIFNRNQLWYFIKDIMTINLRFKHSTAEQTRKLINKLLLTRLVEYSDLKSLEINNYQNISDDKYIKLSVIDNDENLVIWKFNDIPKIVKINRFHSIYYPYLKFIENQLEFQKQISTNRTDSFNNIYDKNFINVNVNATGFWKEVQGNVVSSLFTNKKSFSFKINYPNNNNLIINVIDNLKNIINIDEAIIINKNEEEISKIDKNVENYIIVNYIKWLLLNCYKIDNVTNELGQKLEFEQLFDNNFSLKLKSKSIYYTRFDYAIFNFIRK